jgi:hypothetical protein
LLAAALVGAAAPRPAQAAGGNVLVFGDYSSARNNAAAELAGLGYTVTNVATLPADISGFIAIWEIGAFAPLTAGEQAQIIAFLNSGGGVYLGGERPCCEALNDSVQALVNAVVSGGGVTVGDQGDISGPYNFNASAKGGIVSTPNVLTTWNPSASGGITGLGALPDSNILATGFGNAPVAAVFDESDMSAGAGRLVVMMDVNWFDNAGRLPVIQNIQTFLENGGAPAGGAVSGFVATTEVSLTGSASSAAAAAGDTVLFTFEVGNNTADHETYGLSFRGDAAAGLEVLGVTATQGTVRPLEGQTAWADIGTIYPGGGVRVVIETRVTGDAFGALCVDGAVAAVGASACTTVLPAELPLTGELPAAWGAAALGLLALLGVGAFTLKRRLA